MEPQGCKLSAPAIEIPQSAPARILRVLIDARKLADGGIGTYTANLAAGLVALGGCSVTLLLREEEKLEYAWRSAVATIVDRARPYSAAEFFVLPQRVDFSRFDLFHVPHYTLPFGIPIPAVITLHDLIHVTHPQRWYYPYAARLLIGSGMRRAARVIVVSEATRAAVAELLHCGKEAMSKVRVIGNALDLFFSRSGCVPGYVQRKFGAAPGYLLSVLSLLKPHKGLEHLLEAFAGLHARRPGARLLLAGQGADKIAGDRKFAQRIAAESGITVLGRVSKEDLRNLYAESAGLVVSSLTEGFCLPALEAKAMGIPVVSRPVPAVCTLLDPNDFVCEGYSVPELVNAMDRCLLSAERTGGRRIVPDDSFLNRFDARALAAQVRDVYLEALG